MVAILRLMRILSNASGNWYGDGRATNVGSDLVYRIGFFFTKWSLVVCSDGGPKEEANFVIAVPVRAK